MNQDSPTGWRSWRWPFSIRQTVMGGGAAAAVLGATLGAAYVGPVGRPQPVHDGRVLQIAHFDPKPVEIDPGSRIEVMSDAPDSFQGLPPARSSLETWFMDAFMPSEPVYEPPRVVRYEPVEPPRVRRYASSGDDRDCTRANSRVDAMLCRDERLAAADRAMNRALERVVDDGYDQRMVMRDQAAWERARERAAVDGVQAVERLYDIRLDELEGRR